MHKVFIINLKRSLDRKKAMEDKISKLLKESPKLQSLLEFHFFEAVDAKNDEHLAFEKHFKKACFFQGRELSLGEKGCFASHYKLWQLCVDLNENLFILEDDIFFTKDFEQGILSILESGFEYVRLCALFDKKSLSIDEHFYITYKNFGGTQGYFLAPSAALKFMRHSKDLIAPVDDYMDMFYINGVLNILYKPFLIGVEPENESTIDSRFKKLKGFAKLRRELVRVYFQALRAFWLFLHPNTLKNLQRL
ncbi:lipooligosaccharide biosynthesis glycosyltransferase [Campylobacter sp. MIT 99-7217]|uniref:glycosyltransferase family 25 protein n=1 Tax=Campylobacter sp. MIT 99-7217 TaxID=535091 RepID=UPI00115AD048|nr:glycosyltransferase family 25 protein [Campylobacter sp. MIT 99-7217]TQR34470.1 lipooligosaccharide biosynthesis glycosyltransferase [Campylobacter sp. MIT 99-7217]